MNDKPPNRNMPTELEWDDTARMGDHAVRVALSDVALEMNKRDAPIALTIALALGAVSSVGDFMRLIALGAGPECISAMEAQAIAFLRGALRGVPYPIDEQGNRLEQGLFDA